MVRGRRLIRVDDAWLRERYLTHNIKQMCDASGLSEYVIRRELQRCGLPIPYTHSGMLNRAHDALLLHQYCELGKTIHDISEQFGVSEPLIRRRLRELGLVIPVAHGRPLWMPPPEILEEVAKNSKTIAELAELAGVNRNTLMRGLKDAGIKRKNLSGGQNKLSLARQEFAGVKVIRECGRGDKYGNARRVMWLCECACGNLFTESSSFLNGRYRRSCGCGQYKRMNRYPQLKNPDFLHREYVVEKKSMCRIAREIGCSPSSVERKLRKFGIRREAV